MFFGRPASRRPLVGDSRLPEADVRTQPPDEAHPFGQGLQGVDDLAVHQAEVAAVQRDVQVADRVHDPVEGEVAQSLRRALLALLADGVDDIEPFLPAPDELQQHFRGILEVPVHHDDRPALRVIEAGRNRRLVAEVAAQVDHDHAGVLLLHLVEQPGGRVAAAVVDEDQLVRPAEVGQRGDQATI